MTDQDLIASLDEARVVALTLYGEARAESYEGRLAVADVIRNRVKAARASWGLTAREVCLKRWQFSCWIPEGGVDNYNSVIDAARHLLRGDGEGPILRECLLIARWMLGVPPWEDTVGHATFYYNPKAMIPPGRVAPWVDDGHGRERVPPTAVIGSHRFFAGIA